MAERHGMPTKRNSRCSPISMDGTRGRNNLSHDQSERNCTEQLANTKQKYMQLSLLPWILAGVAHQAEIKLCTSAQQKTTTGQRTTGVSRRYSTACKTCRSQCRSVHAGKDQFIDTLPQEDTRLHIRVRCDHLSWQNYKGTELAICEPVLSVHTELPQGGKSNSLPVHLTRI